MNESPIEKFLSGFRESVRHVLSQCSGEEWRAELDDQADTADLVWFEGTASGALHGGFAFGMPSETGLLLAQTLMMSPEPAAVYDAEQQEAALEFLRQVCGHLATALAAPAGQPVLELKSGDTPSWTPARRQTLKLGRAAVTATLTVMASSELAASLSSTDQPAALENLQETETDRPALQQALGAKNLDLLMDVHLGVRLRFGRRRLKLREILEFHAGTIVELDRQVQEAVDLLVDDKLIARGEVVVIDGNYGLKVTEVLSPRQCMDALC